MAEPMLPNPMNPTFMTAPVVEQAGGRPGPRNLAAAVDGINPRPAEWNPGEATS